MSVAPGIPDAAVAFTRVTVPSPRTRYWLMSLLPVFATYSNSCAETIQQAAICPSETGAPAGTRVPPWSIVNVATELLPALTSTSRSGGPKTNGNGTGAARLRTGCAESWPSRPTSKTSTMLKLFVVTRRCLPFGLNPICAGDDRKNGGFVFARPSARVEPSIASR